MKRWLVLLPALALVGCASTQTWQVVAVYTAPDLPGDVPADAAGRVNFAVDGTTFTGSTGCADVAGEFAQDGDTVTLETITVGDVGECTGGTRHIHEQLVPLLTQGATFTRRDLSEYEVMLTGDNTVDPPSIRLMLL